MKKYASFLAVFLLVLFCSAQNIPVLNHDTLDGFVADEHIDWTNATPAFLTTGTLTASKILHDASTYMDKDGSNNLIFVDAVTGTKTLADLSAAAAGFDGTAVDSTTWSDGANASNTHTFDVSGADTQLIYGNGVITASPAFAVVGGLTISEGALTDSMVIGADIKDDTVDSDDYAAASIDNEHLANDAVDSAEIATNAVKLDALDVSDVSDDIAGDIAAGELTDDSVNDDDINWADLSYLTTNGAAINEAYAAGWNADVGPPEKDDIYDYLVNFDSDADGSFTDESWYTNIADGTLAFTDLNGNVIDSDNYVNGSVDLDDLAAGVYAKDLVTTAPVTGAADNVLVGADSDVTLALDFTAAWDFGGATSLEIPNAADPDVDAAGEISQDTDGANETGDVTIRAFDGTNQWPVGQKLKTLNFTLIEPDLIDAADLIPIWHNTSGMTFTIVEWKAWSDDDDVSLEIEELTDQTDYSARTTVDAVEIATDGTGVYYASDGTITHATIETDNSLAIDFDTSDTPDYVQISIVGWFNADVN